MITKRKREKRKEMKKWEKELEIIWNEKAGEENGKRCAIFQPASKEMAKISQKSKEKKSTGLFSKARG